MYLTRNIWNRCLATPAVATQRRKMSYRDLRSKFHDDIALSIWITSFLFSPYMLLLRFYGDDEVFGLFSNDINGEL